MRIRPPNHLSALAAAATPVVAAALVTLGLVAGACEGSPVSPQASASAASPAPAGTPVGIPTGTPATGGGAPEGRLLVVVGAPSRPRARIIDPASPEAAGLPLDLPAPIARDRLAALVAAPEGRLAAVTPGGRAWVAPPSGIGAADQRWVDLRVDLDRPPPGPVLGATWSTDTTRLILLAGAPGSGTRLTALISVPLDGTPATTVQVPLEADGPGIAALPDGRVALVGRDIRDRNVLALITAAGSFVTRPVAARSVAAGGGVVALIDDVAVRVGTLEDLDRGILPAEAVPLRGTAGVGSVAIAPDGSAIAVVRLDASGAAARIEVLQREFGSWRVAGFVELDPADGTAIPAWLP